jgi:UDP-glucose 4-epimerase
MAEEKPTQSPNTQSSALSPDNSSSPSVLSPQSSFSWLITGGCGFIGRNLISNLVAEGSHFIRIIDNLKVGSREDLKQVCDFEEIDQSHIKTNNSLQPTPPSSLKKVQLVAGDILDAELALKACQGFDVIVHLAANTGVAPSVENPRMDCETNVIGTLNYLEAARQCNVARFVFASSGAPAGEVEPPIHEELPPHPVSPYGASKLAGEGYCSAYYRTFGVETVCLRFGNVYGPLSGKKDSVVAKFIKRAMAGEALEIYGNGTQTRDFIYIDDLTDAIYNAATIKTKCSGLRSQDSANSSPAVSKSSVLSTQHSGVYPQSSVLSPQHSIIAGETFQIATNRETTVREMVDQLLPILAQHGFEDIQLIHGERRKGDVMRNFSDTTKARNVLGWWCAHALEEGLKKTVQWFVDQSPNGGVADTRHKKIAT